MDHAAPLTIVILDVLLPGWSRIDLFHQLRADPTTQTVPVVCFTSRDHLVQKLLPDDASQGAPFVPQPKIEPLIAYVQTFVQ